jgi:hypothetical protein
MGGWVIEAIGSGIADKIWFPSAVHALPVVSLEALDAELAVVFVIATLGW